MLLQLRIENLATISELEVEFSAGFSILTGETGAGKSIMIDAILLVLGHRGDPGMIRTGEELAIVEAIFTVPKKSVQGEQFDFRRELEESGVTLDDEIIIRCQVSRKGRQKRHINGVSVTAEFLQKVGRQLINIHGQHDNQSLLRVSSHLDFLDGYGQLLPLRQEVTASFQALQSAKKEQQLMQKQFAVRAVRVKELQEIIEDLSELNYQQAEESELRQEEKRLTYVEKLSANLGQVQHQLQEMDGAVLEQLEYLRKVISEAEQIDPECGIIRSGIESALFQLEDSHRELVSYTSKIEDDPKRLAWINERLSRIQHFERKFSLENAEELLTLFEKNQQELASLENLVENEQEICSRIERLSKKLNNFAARLSQQRLHAAKKMDQAIVDELHQLGMEKARFETQIVSASLTADEDLCTSTGIDRVEFILTVNPGQEMRSLVKVASGGELSRIMLALKTVLTSLDTVEILIFDEIDTGISGAIAEIVGQKLHSLGVRHQTLCVTHLPQIVAFAEHHYLVSKRLAANETFTNISPLLTQDDRVRALADLIGGQEISENTMELANEMLNKFQTKKTVQDL
ncbi:MAG: DNA repair protein RecN [SAR324 cluster bacterium]|nr:DNA repair protein RecN [SAR324 cluster bacterium]MEE3266656.1 DNA repair protein RecN [SAR324 cluster bacterium]